jgi:hypothetical protein
MGLLYGLNRSLLSSAILIEEGAYYSLMRVEEKVNSRRGVHRKAQRRHAGSVSLRSDRKEVRVIGVIEEMPIRERTCAALPRRCGKRYWRRM